MASRAAKGRVLSILFSTLLLGRAIAVRGQTEVRVELQLDRWAARGAAVRLRCVHDVPAHLLDKVVFLRHGVKIFQYIRDRKPPYRNFTTPGAVLNIALATENSIILQNLDFAASGSYSCEVSLDTPIFSRESAEKQLTVFHPQRHNPRIDFPQRLPAAGGALRANCTSAPALPAPHVTWFVNGKKMDELVVRSHKLRVPMSERGGARRAHAHEGDADMPPSLSHAGHARPPGCTLKEPQEVQAQDLQARHRSHKPRHELYVTWSQLQLVVAGRLHVVCVSTIPEFRSIEDKFADMRNDSVVVDVVSPTTTRQPPANLTAPESSTSRGSRALPPLLALAAALRHLA